jgi:hypothetical protein
MRQRRAAESKGQQSEEYFKGKYLIFYAQKLKRY